jgi:hypothetical protein
MYIFCKTNNPRPTFHLDMTPEERTAMTRHVEYWKQFADSGAAIVFGPVMDPNGVYGIGVYNVQDVDQFRTMLAEDPAKGILQYEFHPMPQVVVGTQRP